MRRRLLTIGAAALATVATVAACGGSSTETATSAPTVTTTAAATEPHNNADVTFAQHMIPHHEQAVQMSDIVLAKQGVDPRVTTLANQIKAAQGPEIQQMQTWLSQWGQPTTMAGQDMGPDHEMSGMVSADGIAALQGATGTDAARLFLTQMIEHHEGAIAMAQDEIVSGQYPPAVAMAQAIVTSQQREIDDMQGILASLQFARLASAGRRKP